MDSALTTIGLPIALAVIMFGLGLGLTGDDFRRVARHPRAVAVAMGCQLVLLPAVCFALVLLFDLPALLGIGMMLLAAAREFGPKCNESGVSLFALAVKTR